METLLNAFAVLLIVIDPVGVAAIFATLTRQHAPQMRHRMAMNATLLASIILLLFFIFGDGLLGLLGITLPAFRIAGGVLLFLLAFDMVVVRQSGLRSTTMREQHEAEQKEDVSVFPLAFPLIAGPGAITTVLLMSAETRGIEASLGLVVMICLVMGLTLLSLLSAASLARRLGETGTNVISRLMGLILAALAVQYILDGIREGLMQ
jgi:multiple antibiotic resistance protein